MLSFITQWVDDVANGFAVIGGLFSGFFFKCINRLTGKRCPHCFILFIKWQEHNCPVVDAEFKRYPEYLYTEVWGLKDYHQEHPRTGLDLTMENIILLGRINFASIEKSRKAIDEHIKTAKKK